jgi:hypothetical protein
VVNAKVNTVSASTSNGGFVFDGRMVIVTLWKS